MSFSIDNNIASELSLSWVIDVIKYDLISFNLEKDLSALATVIGIISNILYDTVALGNGFWRSYNINSNTYKYITHKKKLYTTDNASK